MVYDQRRYKGKQMTLTASQKSTLKADIAANTNTIGGVQIKDLPNTGDNNFSIAQWYSGAASPAYKVWDNACVIKTLRSATDLSKFTPADTPPASGSTAQITNDMLLFNNRALVCQLKQTNALTLIQGEGSVDCTASQFRTSFNDCMAAIPSAAGGGNNNAGWGTQATPGAVRLAMQRSANNIEKLLSVAGSGGGAAGNVSGDARGSATNPDAMVYVGSISGDDIESARNS